MTETRDFASFAFRAAALGTVSGMRSQLPLALLAYAASQGTFAPASGPPLGLLRAPAALPILGLAAIGELIGDKLPFVPSRLAPGPLLGRFLFGALAGTAVALEAGHPAAAGALLGAVGAGIGSHGGHAARVAAGQATGLPDPIWGAVEDAIAISLGLLVLRSLP